MGATASRAGRAVSPNTMGRVMFDRLGPRAFLAALVLCAVFAVFFELGRMDVWSDNEGQRATPPAEMLRTGDFVIPTINGIDYLAKPPLLYWAVAGVYRVTGVISPFTARVVTAVCGCLLVLCVYLCFRRETGDLPARWGALALLTSPYFLERSRWTELDVPLALMTFLAIVGYRRACTATGASRRSAFVVGAGLALGAAIMLKGPAPLLFLWAGWVAIGLTEGTPGAKTLRNGLIVSAAALLVELAIEVAHPLRFPVVLVAVMLYWSVAGWRRSGRDGRVRLALLLAVIAIGVAVCAPWCIGVLNAKGWDYASKLIHGEVLTRTHTATEINSGSSFFYILTLPLLLAPWGLLLPLHFDPKSWRDKDAGYRFPLACGWLSVLVFSVIAGKEYEYILPGFAFLSLATGYHLADLTGRAATGWTAAWMRRWVWVALVLLGILPLAGAIYASVFVRTPALVVECWVLAVTALGLSIDGWRRPMRRAGHVFGLSLATVLVWLLVSRSFYYTGDHSPREIGTTTGRLLQAGYEVEAGWLRLPFPPAFAFYAGAPVPMQIRFDVIREKMAGDAPYYLVTREGDIAVVASELGSVAYEKLLGPHSNKGYILIGNRPLPALDQVGE